MSTPLDAFVSSISVTAHTSGLKPAPDVDGKCDTECERAVTRFILPPLEAGETCAVFFAYDDGFTVKVSGADGPAPGVPDKCSTAGAAMTTPGTWSTEASSTITWFEAGLAAGELPAESFQLEPWIGIANPTKWYTTLCRDIGAGAKGPRAGALLGELRRLRAIVEAK